jgi:thiosulfate dehydrogenase
MRRYIVFLFIFMLIIIPSSGYSEDDPFDYKPVEHDQQSFTKAMHMSRGGQLYDNWWKAKVDVKKPSENHLLWQTQSTNKRNGYATYRCKECHGWDYKGKDGAYRKGSHYTGFKGVYEASQGMSVNELKGVLKGSIKDHDFSEQLSTDDISDLAVFMKYGIIDLVQFLNTDGSPISGDMKAGLEFYNANCMTECHGPDGTAINFGDEEKPQFVGTVASKNPWEVIHKVRAGQPGTKMSSGIVNKWSNEDIRNLIAYSQTLPKELPEIGWFDRIMGTLGIGEKKQESRIPKEYRGFGPKIAQ